MESMQIPGITYNKTAACQQQQAPSKDIEFYEKTSLYPNLYAPAWSAQA